MIYLYVVEPLSLIAKVLILTGVVVTGLPQHVEWGGNAFLVIVTSLPRHWPERVWTRILSGVCSPGCES
jgi:hypothetical protein